MTRITCKNCHFAAIYILLSVIMFIIACNSLDPTDFGKKASEQRVMRSIFPLLIHEQTSSPVFIKKIFLKITVNFYYDFLV